MSGTARPEGYGVASMEEIRKLSGLEFLRAILEGRLPAAPITHTLGFQITKVEEGFAVFSGTPTWHHLNPIGSIHGGWVGTILDSCMACAVQSTLEAGLAYTTLEYKVNCVRALTEATGLVHAEGRVIYAGRRAGTAEGRLVDASGKLYAHGTTTCMVFPL